VDHSKESGPHQNVHSVVAALECMFCTLPGEKPWREKPWFQESPVAFFKNDLVSVFKKPCKSWINLSVYPGDSAFHNIWCIRSS
jgi:hypothetical protein